MKKKKKKNGQITITKAKLNSIKKKIHDEVFYKYFLIISAATMDELNIGVEEIYKIGKRAERYCDNVEDHLLGMNDVAKIMREKGLDIKDWK